MANNAYCSAAPGRINRISGVSVARIVEGGKPKAADTGSGLKQTNSNADHRIVQVLALKTALAPLSIFVLKLGGVLGRRRRYLGERWGDTVHF
jgi:hypothetical protein